jgi:hypothetical protein
MNHWNLVKIFLVFAMFCFTFAEQYSTLLLTSTVDYWTQKLWPDQKLKIWKKLQEETRSLIST